MTPTARADWIVLGRVVGAHGVHGQLRVRFLGEELGHLLEAREVGLARSTETPEERRRVVEARAGRRGEVRMRLAGIESREMAETLCGLHVLVPTSVLDPLPPGEFYCYQLLGCEVWGHDGSRLGKVTRVIETGGHDVLVVHDQGGQERLLPAAEDLLREVDVERGRIVIELIPGLLDPS